MTRFHEVADVQANTEKKRKENYRRDSTSTQSKLGIFRHCVCLVQNNELYIHL
jgi:hypothetical protein